MLVPALPHLPLTLEIRPARFEEMYPILTLHSEAFADKFGAAFGTHGIERGIEALAEGWRRQGSYALRGMFVAVADAQVVGTVTLRTWEMAGDDGGAVELAFQRVLGVWGALRSTYALSLLGHQISREEAYLTDVAVLAAYRRRGIAHALLARAEAEALGRRKRVLSLYVSGSNRRARTLYSRFGFVRRHTRFSVMAALMLRQASWLYMQKPLPPVM